jgi:hypothetical protein
MKASSFYRFTSSRPAVAVFSTACILFAVVACKTPSPVKPAITSFRFLASANSAVLGSDVNATIDDEGSLVTACIPASVTDYSLLVPSIQVPEGCTIAPDGGKIDYSESPTELAVFAPDGSYRSYKIRLIQAVAYAPSTAVKFTEYYMGAGSGYEGELNRWIELTNEGTSAVDLSQYVLAFRAREDGVRAAARDVLAPLSGTLAAGSSLVIYSSRLDTATFASWPASTVADTVTNDLSYNTIDDFDGDDGFQLLRDGAILDCIGPNGGMGADYYWGRNKRMLRKTTATAGSIWDEKQWVAYTVADAASDAANAGADTQSFASTNTTLSFFAFETLATPAYGTIDSASHTVSISLQEGTNVHAIPTSFSTEGAGVTVNGNLITSGVSAIDYSSPVVFTVWAADGATHTAYTATISYYHVLGFTDVNYDFSGGIASVLGTVKTGGSSTTDLATTIEGVLTAKDVYMTSTFKNCFYLQDKDAGIVVLSTTSIPYPLGARLRVEVSSGTVYYDMPEIKAYGTITRVGSAIQDIYYKTGNYATLDSLGSVYRWKGTILEGTDGYYVGTFEGGLCFHTTSALEDSLKAGATGVFYGPVSLSYSVYRMEINNAVQIGKE